jgi:hypothetical protein
MAMSKAAVSTSKETVMYFVTSIELESKESIRELNRRKARRGCVDRRDPDYDFGRLNRRTWGYVRDLNKAIEIVDGIPTWCGDDVRGITDKWKEGFDKDKREFIGKIEKSRKRAYRWAMWDFFFVVTNALFAMIEIGYGASWAVSVFASVFLFVLLLQRYAETKWLDEYLFLVKLGLDE